MKRNLFACLLLLTTSIFAQQNRSLVNTSQSPNAKLSATNMGDVLWTKGFWAERFDVCKNEMIPNIWHVYTDANISHSFENFKIAAGIDTGSHSGPSFHDGDFYKVLEAVAAVYAVTKDKTLDSMMDEAIAVIAKAQREDGYIYTPALIEARKDPAKAKAFAERINFEAYNFGHLMTAGCVHYRATGKKTLLNIAIKSADFLNAYYNHASPELARNAICPSHYMGLIELYRTTNNKVYLDLAKNLIDIRGYTNDGTDDNQDRIPFRRQTKAIGHAVRANYLYAGVTDVYAETKDDSLMYCLDHIWNDLVYKKMYITGGCGAMYDGVSPNGTSYNPNEIQKTHQAYGLDYQLPNTMAYNETCANIGNLLWNWRMFQATANSKYIDVLEQTLYNSILSGINLKGNEFFYTNPLSSFDNFPYTLRWAGGRQAYIKLSNCCPPNVIRTIAEISDYAYSISDKGIYCNLYSGNQLSTKLKDGSVVKLAQESNYPWSDRIVIKMQQVPSKKFSLFLRIPSWCSKASITVNDQPVENIHAESYAEIERAWKKNDSIVLTLPMKTKLMESNPLVEDSRNMVAVKRGPVVYCLESTDLSKDEKVADIVIPASIQFTPQPINIAGSEVLALTGKASCRVNNNNWQNRLYQEFSSKTKETTIRLVPYYTWANRGHSEMSVWLPVSR